MENIIFAITAIATGFLLVGCASSNIKKFNPDPLFQAHIEKHITKKIFVNILMHKKDSNFILCRIIGNIYLPNKITYSKYIEDAFKTSLLLANRLAETQSNHNSLLVTLTKVDFNSINGKWYVNGEVMVNNSAPITIDSKISFGTSWDAESACNNVANSFDEAVRNFVNEVLSNRSILNLIR